MTRAQRAALLTLLDSELKKRGSWCGETHIQKSTFFLQELLGVDAGFEFILYHHGPFCFELRDELACMQADGLLELTVRYPGYGPSYYPTQFSHTFLTRFPKTAGRYYPHVEFVANELGSKGVSDLEKLATSLFLTNREGVLDPEERARRLVELKPHISLPDARAAAAEVDRIVERSLSFARNAEE